MKFNHNGNVHNIVEGIDLFEMNNSNITHVLEESDDYFRFTVTGTEFNTGLRNRFRFLLKASVRPAQRGSLDVVYLHRLIDETVRDVLARENYFITGSEVLVENGKTVPPGGQFERAFNRHILSPNSIVHRLPNERVIAFDGASKGVNACRLTEAELEEGIARHQEGHQIVIVAGAMIYTYSCEDEVKWGMDEFKPARIDGLCTDQTYVDILNHFQTAPGVNQIAYPLTIYSQDAEGHISLLHAFNTEAEVSVFITPNVISVKKTTPVPPRLQSKQPVASPDYQAALDKNDQVMSASSPAHRGRWRTLTGGVEQPR